MTEEEVAKIVTKEIRSHELRVAAISGPIGFILIAGLFHAIYLNHSSIIN